MNMKEEFEKSVNIIEDWLKKNGDSEIAKQVEQEAKELCEQETLEDAIRKEYKFRIGSHSFSNPLNIGGQQERMYSEEDMRIAYLTNSNHLGTFEDFIKLF